MIQKSLLLLLAFLFGATSAFQPIVPLQQQRLAVPIASTSALYAFGGKKKLSPEEQAKAEKYWQGEWVCKDCGYIYNRVRGIMFKLMKRSERENRW